MKTLTALLTESHFQLFDLRARYQALRAFAAELEAISRGRDFEVRGPVVWMMVVDSRDMLVTHFASWAKSAYSPGGFFGQLRQHIATLRPSKSRLKKLASHSRDPEGTYRMMSNAAEEAFQWVFPGADDLQPAAIDDLKERFYERTTPLVQDRSENRAHRYERARKNARMLGLQELGSLLDYSDGMLTSLCVLAAVPTQCLPYVANHKAVARELVDQVLLGGMHLGHHFIPNILERNGFYEELHVRSPNGTFNQDLSTLDQSGRGTGP